MPTSTSSAEHLGWTGRGGDALVVVAHVINIFDKLGLGPMPSEHRRVHAALTHLRGAPN